MAECSLLEAALRHNPLFFLAAPNSSKKASAGHQETQTTSGDLTSACRASGEDDSARRAANASPPKQVAPKEASSAPMAPAAHGLERNQLTAKAVSRKERKRRKMAALLGLILRNDEAKTADVTAAADGGQAVEDEVAVSSKRPCLTPTDGTDRSARVKTSQVKPDRVQRGHVGCGSADANDDSSSHAKFDQEMVPPASEPKCMDYQKMRHAVKQKRRKKRRPEFHLSTTGDHASLVMADYSRTPLFLRDVQTLLLNACVPDHAPYPTRWCNLTHASHLSRTLAVVVDGLSLQQLQLHARELCSTLTLFPHQTELVSPAHYGTSVAEEILNVPLSMTLKHRLVKRLGSLDGAVQAGLIRRRWGDPSAPTSLPRALPTPGRPAAIGRTQLLLDIGQLMDEGYPLPDTGHYSHAYRHYVPTKDKYRPVTDESPMFAVDCEMCLTREGHELTSISVLSESEELVYGSLVQPENVIIDYITRYSGITADRLKGVTIRLADVQRNLRELLPPDAILIGQSFNNDLRALQMMHPYIIDTSVIFNITGERRRKTKLSLLSSMFLGETIQQAESCGHDATEDALASLRLVQRKLARGYTYGDAVQGGYVPSAAGGRREEEEEERDGALPTAVNMDGFYTSLLARMDEVGVTTSIVSCGPATDIYRLACETTDHPSLTLRCAPSNRQACDQAAAALTSADLTLCHMELRDRLHWSWPAEHSGRHLHKLDGRLLRLYRAAPAHTLLVVVCTGAAAQDGTVHNGVCLVGLKQEPAGTGAAASGREDDTDTAGQ